jgi:hypothetical protein
MEAGLWPVEEMQHGTKVQKVCVLAIGELVALALRCANLRCVTGLVVVGLRHKHEALDGIVMPRHVSLA